MDAFRLAVLEKVDERVRVEEEVWAERNKRGIFRVDEKGRLLKGSGGASEK
jgi:hypothetical protein